MLTPAELDALIALYSAALEAVLKRQSYRIGERELKYANLGEIQSELNKLRAQKALQSTGRRGRIATIRTAC